MGVMVEETLRAWRWSRLLKGYASTRSSARRSTPQACTDASAGSLPPPISAANSSVTCRLGAKSWVGAGQNKG